MPHELAIGAFYETETGEIVRTSAWNGRDRTVRYDLGDGRPGATVGEDEVAGWRRRDDLRDFPNSIDPRLPYAFDLAFDVDRRSRLVELLIETDDREPILSLMRDEGVVLEDDEIARIEVASRWRSAPGMVP